MSQNPFTPGFGLQPAVLIGREQAVAAVSSAFAPEPSPYRATWLRGPRGSGKTTLLDAIQVQAGLAGWLVIQEDGTSDDLVDRLRGRVAEPLRRDPPAGRRVSAKVTLPVVEMQIDRQRDPASRSDPTLRDVLEAVVALDDVNGVLLSIDEVHTADRRQLAVIGNAVQHLLRGNDPKPVAIVVAGLPEPSIGAEDDQLATFLTRCRPVEVGQLADDAVRAGLQATASTQGRAFTPAALALAVSAAAGYPFMVQLVGWHAWELQPDAQPIGIDAVRAALPAAEGDLRQSVLIPVARPLSDMDRRYLRAMAKDPGPSKSGDVARRIGRSLQYAGVYRDRLIELGLVRSAGHGLVDFALPGLRALYRSDTARQASADDRQE